MFNNAHKFANMLWKLDKWNLITFNFEKLQNILLFIPECQNCTS